MPKIVTVGPPAIHCGKTLWEIVGNLKNYGIGRLVQRSIHEKYPEPSYFRILKIDTLPAPTEPYGYPRKVRAYTERVFRGRKYELVHEIEADSWHPDYKLVPKTEEKALIEKAEAAGAKIKMKVYPSKIPFPPFLKELIVQERKAKGLPVEEEPKMKLHLVESPENDLLYRVGEDGEEQNVGYDGGKGVPVTPKLYEIPELFKKKLDL